MEISNTQFRWISTMEAISFLVLLGIAMPLKYIWGWPTMVQVIGMAHGILFMAYIAAAFIIKDKQNWDNRALAVVMLCAILPFGPFYVERKYLK